MIPDHDADSRFYRRIVGAFMILAFGTILLALVLGVW